MLQIKKLRCQKGNFRLSIDNFKITKSGVFLLNGLNGSGKTTLLKCLAGSNKFNSGEVLLNNKNKNISSLVNLNKISFKNRAKYVSYMPQNIIAPDQKVKEFLILGRLPYTNMFNHYKKEDWDIVYQYSKMFDLNRFLDRTANTLSGGELQRIYLAKLFIQSPNILLLDEPTSSLDLKYKVIITNLIHEYSKTHPDKVVLIVTHEPWFFENMCKDVFFIDDGKITKTGNVNDIRLLYKSVPSLNLTC